jgi:hypothetical protein
MNNLLHGDLSDYWNYILSGLDVVGLVALRAVGKKNAKGWLWAMFTQGVWMVYSVSTFQWGFLVVAAVKFGVYTWNWLSWMRSDKVDAEERSVEKLAMELAKAAMPNANGVALNTATAFLVKASKAAALYQEKGVKAA